MPRFSLLTAGATALALTLAACGGSSSSSSTAAAKSTAASSSAASTARYGASSGTSTSGSAVPAGAGAARTTLSLAAQPSGQLMFTKTALTAKAGTVTVNFTNDSPLAHNLTIAKGTNGPIVGATPTFQHGAKALTVKLTAGIYTFFCSVPGHRTAGMQGTLTVH